MGSNKIQEPIPSSICNLLHLQSLDINHNNLSSRIPSCIGDLSEIELLDLSRNQITIEIPPSFEKLKHLAELNLSQNLIEGSEDDNDEKKSDFRKTMEMFAIGTGIGFICSVVIIFCCVSCWQPENRSGLLIFFNATNWRIFKKQD
ncbi:Leucine-rich repeat-containing protein [Artemisia annua]|uniref:Leucine-rich repeat-containing protein n=1 Tax=Artemisia annua TaxID=35608 RepID=A0A2U1MV82_ARTAN|nr:Leucine-rich repeat-containing protein [Artemisia annua]